MKRIPAFPVLLLTGLLACSVQAEPMTPVQQGSVMTLNGMTMTDTVKGKGPAAKRGNIVVVHYTGWLYDPTAPGNKGQKFDSSVDRGEPFSFMLGAGRVIRGWDEGLVGMTVGSKRTLVIPPTMGYGSQGAGNVIPPNATLVFDVDLLELR